MLTSPYTVLLYPSDNAINVAELSKPEEPYNLVVLDGTWAQAKAMYNQNEILRKIKAVGHHISDYLKAVTFKGTRS